MAKRTTKKKPVLFIIFNRPNTTKKVFEAIKKYRPNELYIAADGPRDNKVGEKERCEEARKIAENIDWPCKVKRLYRNKNLGCKYAVSGAIDWFFENVEEGIILEDDCLPNSSFFSYCGIMLDRYRNNINVMHITGDNYQDGVQRGEKGASYYFSKYPHIWGWATWKRAWKNYDVAIKGWLKDGKNMTRFHIKGIWTKIYWKSIFDLVARNKIDTWDYQWTYACLLNKGIVVTPNVNLVRNIGLLGETTHIKKPLKWILELKTQNLRFPIVHPVSIKIDEVADHIIVKKFFNLRNLLGAFIYYLK